MISQLITKEVKAYQNQDHYCRAHGFPFYAGNPELHRNPSQKSQKQWKRLVEAESKKSDVYHEKRVGLQKEFEAKLLSGEIRLWNAKEQEEDLDRYFRNADPATPQYQSRMRLRERRNAKKEKMVALPAFELSAPIAPVEIPAAPVPAKKAPSPNTAERAEVMRASYAAAESFELGGDPLDNLTGQGALFF